MNSEGTQPYIYKVLTLKGECPGLSLSPERWFKTSLTVPVNVILFRNRVFAGVPPLR